VEAVSTVGVFEWVSLFWVTWRWCCRVGAVTCWVGSMGAVSDM